MDNNKKTKLDLLIAKIWELRDYSSPDEISNIEPCVLEYINEIKYSLDDLIDELNKLRTDLKNKGYEYYS